MAENNLLTQYDKVLMLMQHYKILRTDQVKILAMRCGISCGEVYIREMRRKNIVRCKRMYNPETDEKDATVTWILNEYFDSLSVIDKDNFIAGEAHHLQIKTPEQHEQYYPGITELKREKGAA